MAGVLPVIMTFYLKERPGEAEFLEPYYAYIDDGRLRLKSGYTLASGWEEPSPLLRKEFETSGEVSSAMLYMSSLGVYEASINGEEVTTGWFNPGFKHFYYEPCVDESLEYARGSWLW